MKARNLLSLSALPLAPLTRASLAALLWMPLWGFCEEVTIGIDSTYAKNSNFYGSSSNEEDVDSIAIGGIITVERREDRLRYLASYAGSYQSYRDQDEADAPEHRLRLRGSYDIDARTTLHFKDSFRDISNLRFSREDIRDGDTGLLPGNDNDSYQRNDFELSLHRDITRSWELEVSADHQFVKFESNEDRSDSESIEIGGRVLYRYAPRHRFGGGLSWVRQDFDGADTRLGASVDYLLTDLAWVFDVSENIRLEVNGGPAWISTDEDAPLALQQQQFVGGSQRGELLRANVRSCDFDELTATGIASDCDFNTLGADPIPAQNLGEVQSYSLGAGPRQAENDDMSFFGGVSLEATLSDWTVSAELRRRQSATSGDSLAASLTKFRWELGYAPAGANWDTYLAGSWEQREALSDATTIDYTVIAGPDDAAQRNQAFTSVRDSDARRDAFTALVGVRTQFSRALSGSAGLRFRRTERQQSGQGNDTDTYFFVVTASYVFDAFHL